MNDDRRVLLGRLFDGDLSPAEESSAREGLRGDAAANRYLAELAAIRALARSHSSAAAGAPRLAPAADGFRPRRLRVAAGLAAAALLGFAGLRMAGLRTGPPAPAVPTADRPVVVAGPATAATATAESRPVAQSLEVALCEWANASPRRPEAAARAVWGSIRRRRAALEVLTLDFVNAPARSSRRLERAVVARRPPAGGRVRPEPVEHRAPTSPTRSA